MKTIEHLAVEKLNYLIVTAFEGGSGYWAELRPQEKEVVLADTPDMEGEPTSERFHKSLEEGSEHDIFSRIEEKYIGTITLESSKKALETMALKYVDHYARIVNDSYDAEDADVWFQLAVMGEVRYG